MITDIKKPIVLISIFLLLTFATIGAVTAQQVASEEPATSREEQSDHLVVPVFPRLKKDDAIKSVEDLKDAYVVLEDGAVVSMADWVLGSLNKSNVGAGMSDYENRMFLGQVARAVAGLDQDLVYRSFEDAGPPVPYVPYNPPAAVQAVQGLLANFIPALGPNWSTEIPDPKLTGITDRRSGGTNQFEEQFNEALNQSNADLFYVGTVRTMLKDAEKK